MATPLATALAIDATLAVDDTTAAGLLHPLYRAALSAAPRGPLVARGLPFRPAGDGSERRWLLVDRPVRIDLDHVEASHLVLLAFCDAWRDASGARPVGVPLGWVVPVGEPLARMTIHLEDGTVETPLRRRFEVNEGIIGWGSGAFLAVPLRAEQALDARGPHPRQPPGRYAPTGHAGPMTVLPGAWGPAQTGVQDHVPSPTDGLMLWLRAVDVRAPEGTARRVVSVELAPVPGDAQGRLVVVSALTAFAGSDSPLRWRPRRALRLTAAVGMGLGVDLGTIAHRGPLAARGEAAIAGWGVEGRQSDEAELVELTAADDAVLRVGPVELPLSRLGVPGDAVQVGQGRISALAPPDRPLRVRLVSFDGVEQAARVRVVARDGRSLPPAGHQRDVNPGLYEDLGADVLLGGAAYAYVEGTFDIEIPADGAMLEAVHGVDVAPARADIGVADLARGWIELTFGETVRPSVGRWVSGDTHVHFLSPSTALFQARAEGVNVVHLLATQWGDLHTSVTDLGADPVSRDGEHAVWVGSENRQNQLGHVGIVGTARPVLPFASGGPPEGPIGGAVTHLMADWLARCREQGGLAIGAHFPLPMAEIAMDIDAGLLDALELQCFDLTLESPPIREWYRYLDAGYRLPLVGGTDKMSAEVPLGQVRTWARLHDDAPLTFDAWAEAIRAGRTFVSSGPVLELQVDGHEPGSALRLSAGATVEIALSARAAQPVISGVELVVDGVVVAARTSDPPAAWVVLRETVRVDRSGWLAGRSRSPFAIGSAFATAMAAHSSPVYLEVPGRPRVPPDLTTPLALIDGTRAWLQQLAPIRDPRELQRFRELLDVHERRLRERGR